MGVGRMKLPERSILHYFKITERKNSKQKTDSEKEGLDADQIRRYVTQILENLCKSNA